MEKKPEINSIREGLESVMRGDFIPIENRNFTDVGYVGQIFGMVYEGNPIPKDETLYRLSLATSINELIEQLRFIVGAIWIFVEEKDKTFLLSSTSAPPLFFYQKDGELFFTTVESDICKTAAENGEYINSKTIHRLLRPQQHFTNAAVYDPNDALFQNVVRIPGGYAIEIDNGNAYSYYCYLYTKPKARMQYNYKYFKKVLEGTAKLIVDSGNKLYVLYSGGVDCSCVHLSLKKYIDDVHLVSNTQDFNGSFDRGYMRETKVIAEGDVGV